MSLPAVVFITTTTTIYSCGHELQTLLQCLGQLSPPWDGKMSVSFWAG